MIKKLFLMSMFCLWSSGAWADRTTTICASGCDQTSIANWLTNVVPATLTQVEIADIQGALTETVTIGTGKTTSSSNYLKLTSSINKGKVATDANWSAEITGNLTVAANYTQIEWQNVTGRISGSSSITPVTIHDVIVHDANENLISTGANSTYTIYNALLYNNTGATNFKSGIMQNGTGNTTNVYNCTAFNMKYRGFDRNAGSGMNVVNSYAGTCGGTCFDVTTTNSGFNMSSDTSATTSCTLGGCANSKAASTQFVSTTTGSENLHIKAGADIIAAGTSESGVFTNDIDNQTRVIWDIGADAYFPTHENIIRNATVNNATFN